MPRLFFNGISHRIAFPFQAHWCPSPSFIPPSGVQISIVEFLELSKPLKISLKMHELVTTVKYIGSSLDMADKVYIISGLNSIWHKQQASLLPYISYSFGKAAFTRATLSSRGPCLLLHQSKGLCQNMCKQNFIIRALPLVTSRGALATVQSMGHAKGAGSQIAVNLESAIVPVISSWKDVLEDLGHIKYPIAAEYNTVTTAEFICQLQRVAHLLE
ncbi:hypothetical protein GG344DRAFT_68996 [Lentinula edodes]|nr:hypothetical protein GG344DRAFT_68996 [Lentinula edodes]